MAIMLELAWEVSILMVVLIIACFIVCDFYPGGIVMMMIIWGMCDPAQRDLWSFICYWYPGRAEPSFAMIWT